MSLHKLTAGDGYTYLTRQVAAHDASNRGYDTLGAYYTEKGEAPGRWLGRGLADVPEFPVAGQVTEEQMVALFGEGRHPNAVLLERALISAGATAREVERGSRLGAPYRVHEQANQFNRRSAGAFRDFNTARGRRPDDPVPEADRARLRTDLARVMFAESYGRDPVDARELSGFLARATRQATTAVAGYDLTFSPVKSVSTLWAVAPAEVARVVEQAHADAVADTVAWLEDHAAYTRRGRNGVAQVEVRGLVAAAFTHRDSRAGDPDLHTHVAVSNKVQALDGTWLALDGRVLYKNNVAASERYNTRVEALLSERLGVVFADRPGSEPGRRAVREIVGVGGDLPRAWSTRRASIETRRAVLAAAFQADHGRPPTAKEALALAQQANLETRAAKHAPRSHAEQRASWRAQALAVLGGEQDLQNLLDQVLHPPQGMQRQVLTPAWVAATAQDVLAQVEQSRATWQANHVRAEAERAARSAGIPAAVVDEAVDAVVHAALSPALAVSLTPRPDVDVPGALRRSDGSSVYEVAGSALYTSSAVLQAEQLLLQAAGRRDGRVVAGSAVDVALLESTANGVPLNPGQVQLVRDLAGSGARVQLALAPAGTGKTAALHALAQAWRHGGGTVIGLAPSAAAAAVLRAEIGAGTDTLAKLVHATSTGRDVPGWVTGIEPATLVVVDEAGMAATPDLACAVDYVLARGGSVRLVGDDRQLAAIGAGGVLRDIAAAHGAAALSQVLRFTDADTGAPRHDEGAASVALRAGDPAALAYYTDHGRVHVGDLTTAADQAYTAWAADRAAGADSVMLAPTRDLVAELNTRARADRLAAASIGTGVQLGGELALAGGAAASAGDTVITTSNNRRIPLGPTDWVKNGDRWTVHAVRATGALDVAHARTGRVVTLPADYAAQHVALGYACTVHAAQGVTAGTAHTVATGQESRQLFYVAMTRGRHGNHVYLTTAGDGDPHTLITRDALLPPTAVDVLTRVLARNDAPASATSTAAQLSDAAAQLGDAADQYWHSLTAAAEARLGSGGLTRLGETADAAHPGLSEAPAWAALRAHLALAAAGGTDPAHALHAGLTAGPGLDDAHDVAAVLDWRLDTLNGCAAAGPLPWLPAVPDTLLVGTQWGRHLTGIDRRVTGLAGEVAAAARAWTPAAAPAWAVPLLDADPALVADLAVWRAAHRIPDTDPNPTGPPAPPAADTRAQRALDHRVERHHHRAAAAVARWALLGSGIDPRLLGDPYWPVLADRLTAARRAGLDVPALLHDAARAGPLPDEQPAAAFWWRLHVHLSPAALDATSHTSPAPLHPDWEPALTGLLGPNTAARVQSDPAWPTLVAAVTDTTSAGWDPQQALATAHESLLAAQPDDAPLQPAELARALAWRVEHLLADPTRADATHDGPGCTSDPDWLVGLTEPPPEEFEPPPEDDQPPAGATGPTGATDADPDGGQLLTADGARLLADALRQALRPESPPDTYPSDADIDAMLEEAHRWDTALVSRERLLQLNDQAAAFYASCYPGSWAPGYLTGRLGTDPAADGRYPAGYAPDSWTALTTYMRQCGATDQELLSAGLASRAATGRLIDRFRDRAMFSITDAGEIHGFIGRRNPATDDAGNPAPKYLNTPDTDLFTKGRELYGLSEAATDLAAGATPVLVEGPLDAIAVTLAGQGRYAGVAPLGTALTDTQADKLTNAAHAAAAPSDGPVRTVVATDADTAGDTAARRAYWDLTARGGDPARLTLIGAKDPAELLHRRGPQALLAALDDAAPLSTQLVAEQVPAAGRTPTSENLARAADVVTALPEPVWGRHLSDLVHLAGGDLQQALHALARSGDAWSADPRAAAADRAARRPTPPAATSPDPASRWAAVAERAHPGLSADPGWDALCAALRRAARAGVDSGTALRALLAQDALPEDHAARTLEYRLLNAYPQARRPVRGNRDAGGVPDQVRTRLVSGDEAARGHAAAAAGGNTARPRR